MSKRDKFKAVFTRKSKLQEKLQQRTREAMAELSQCRSVIETLGEQARKDGTAAVDRLEQQVFDAVSLGMKDPGKAWVAMDELTTGARQQRAEMMGSAGKADKADPGARFKRSVEPTRKTLAFARAGTRDIPEDDEASRLIDAVETLVERFEALVKSSGQAPTAQHCETLEQVRRDAGDLVREIRGAQGLDPQPGSQRASSRAVADGIGEIAGLGDKLKDPGKSPNGLTSRQEVMGRLEVFDDHFAEDETKDPGAKVRNGAMRIAAVTSVLSDRSARTVNDPFLTARINRSMITEYEPDLGLMLAQGQDDEDAGDTLKLAGAMAMDDPVLKLMTGKLDPMDAVQSIRDMAEAGGQKPSVMLKLLRKQFEMKIGSLTMDEVSKGRKMNDPIAQGGFSLATITGEMSPDQVSAMVGKGGTGRPEMQDGGGGLALKPGGSQYHTVVAGDTFESLATHYASSPAKWETIRKGNKATKVGDQIHDLSKTKAKDPLPVGAVIVVPGKTSILDQLEPYVTAWDDEAGDTPAVDQAGARAPTAQPKAASRPAGDGTAPKGGGVTPEALRDAFSHLTSPRTTQRGPDGRPVDPGKTDLGWIQVPGLGQDHAPRVPLGEEDNPDALHGQINDRQYAHMRLLAKSDIDDREAALQKDGKPVEDTVVDKIRQRYGENRVSPDLARKIAKAAEQWIAKVPLTVTFTADRMFSDEWLDAPTHGEKYASDVVLTRGQENIEDLVGRGQTVKGKVGTQGGSKTITGWKERGDNYMRWRRDKDDREGRHDTLAYEDQQIFAAANPAFEKAKGGAVGEYGTNYYGACHFLLRDVVRNRCAFIVRSGAGSGLQAVQRKDVGMLIYDMLQTTGNSQFLDAMIGVAAGKGAVVAPKLDWEAHLYGGFDMAKDAAAIYVQSDMPQDLRDRILGFTRANGMKCEEIGSKPKGLELVAKGEPTKVELPDLG